MSEQSDQKQWEKYLQEHYAPADSWSDVDELLTASAVRAKLVELEEDLAVSDVREYLMDHGYLSEKMSGDVYYLVK